MTVTSRKINVSVTLLLIFHFATYSLRINSTSHLNAILPCGILRSGMKIGFKWLVCAVFFRLQANKKSPASRNMFNTHSGKLGSMILILPCQGFHFLNNSSKQRTENDNCEENDLNTMSILIIDRQANQTIPSALC